MKKRKGSMAICLLILFSMLLTLFTALLFFLSHTTAEVYLYREGQRSVYAVESGANWAIGYLKEGNRESTTVTLTENGRTVKVKVKMNTKADGGTIESAATDSEGGNKKVLRLTYTLGEAEDEATVTVTDIVTSVQ